MRAIRWLAAPLLLLTLYGCGAADDQDVPEAGTWERLTFGLDAYATHGGTLNITGRYTSRQPARPLGPAGLPTAHALP